MTSLSLAVVLALSSRADVLVKDLGSPSFREREAAQAGLLSLGGPALPAVNRAATSPDLEVAKRARSLARDIGFRLDCARLLAGTTIDLDFRDAPLSAVLTELSRQSGYAVGMAKSDADPDTMKVTLRTGAVPFWKAMEAVGKATGLVVQSQVVSSPATVRYFVPGAEAAVPTAPAEKLAASIADIDRLCKFANRLDPNAIALLETYRVELNRIAEEVARIEHPLAKAMNNPAQKARVANQVARAESLHAAAQNLFTAAGVPIAFGAGGRHAVVLGPATGPGGSFHAGVRIEPTTTPPAATPQQQQVEVLAKARGQVPAGAVSGPTVHLRVVPEPKIEWVRTTGVRVEHATDDRGQPIMPNLSVPAAMTSAQAQEILMLQGRVLRSSLDAGTVARPNALSASVLLKCELPAPTTLKEFRGVIQGLVRANPAEVLAQSLTLEKATAEGKKPVGADPRQMVIRMANFSIPTAPAQPTLSATVRPSGTEFALDVSLAYASDMFTPFEPDGAHRNLQTTQQFRAMRGAGGIVEVIGQHGTVSAKSETLFGLRVTDDAGRPFRLHGTVEIQRTYSDGAGSVAAKLTLNATPTEFTKGPPVRIGWTATRFAPVEVPFDLKNVPVVK